MSIWDDLNHFTPEEFDYPDDMDETFLRALDLIRSRAGVPMVITSDYRPGDLKAHGRGLAVDATDDSDSDGVTSQWRYKILKAAIETGILRIGIYDKHIHLDIWQNAPQEVIWYGSST